MLPIATVTFWEKKKKKKLLQMLRQTNHIVAEAEQFFSLRKMFSTRLESVQCLVTIPECQMFIESAKEI